MKIEKLREARQKTNDEFYTLLCDIEEEMVHYEGYFKGKVVYCNCDDPAVSNFYKYFHDNFSRLGLKSLIATYYREHNLFNGDEYESPIAWRYDGTSNNGWRLKGDGDFRSDECISLLEQADVVVTNPPFSLFREYMKILLDYEKKFIILGNQNAIAYGSIFDYIKEDKIRFGFTIKTNLKFDISDDYDVTTSDVWHDDDGGRFIKIAGVRWFTNVFIKEIERKLVLKKKYKGNESDYPKFDNYNYINVDSRNDIPKDYDGIMGVPITLFDKKTPERFDILGLLRDAKVNGKNKYLRFLVINKKFEKVEE